MDARTEVELVASGIEGMMLGSSPAATLAMKASISLASTSRKMRSLACRLVLSCSSPDKGPSPTSAFGTNSGVPPVVGSFGADCEVADGKLELRER